MIIVTGADNMGKTSLVEHLSKQLNIPTLERFHSLPPHEHAREWFGWMYDTLSKNPNVIADRFYLDEFAYGPVVRERICITQEQAMIIDELLVKNKPLVIHCDVAPDIWTKNYELRGQYVDSRINAEVQKKFHKVLWSNYAWLRLVGFDYTKDSEYKNITRTVEKFINGQLEDWRGQR